jgi:hypothetical protein
MREKQAKVPVLAPIEQPVIGLDASVDTPVKELAQPEQPPVVDPEPAPPAAPPEPVETLSEYARRVEELAQPLAVCQITHPDAVQGAIHVGKYAGIRLVRGDTLQALLSDGSTI